MRTDLSGKRIAVAGMGVSGVAVARAAKSMGAIPTVLDEQPGDLPRVLAAVDTLQSIQVNAVTSWHGRLDPNDYDYLVVSPGFPIGHPATTDMAGRVVGEIEFGSWVAKAPILAVTGTNGKSTTTVMAWLCAQGAGLTAALCGNISGTGYPEQVFTDAAVATPPNGLLVTEVSSAQLETVDSFRPKVCAVTNITQDHGDRYKDPAGYRAAKLRIFQNLQDGDTVVLNADEPTVTAAEVADIAPKARIVTFSPSGKNTANGTTRRIGDQVSFSGEVLPANMLPFSGEHNIANAFMAWEMVAAIVQTPDAGMLRGLLGFKPLANRMEPLGSKADIEIINNSMCTNPMAVVRSCQAIPKRQHLLMGGNTKESDYKTLRDYLKVTGQKVYLFGNGYERLDTELGGGWPHFQTLELAFLAAVEAASPGDVVMLAPGCSSIEPYANFKERGDAFKKMATDWLKNEMDSKV